MSWYTKKKMKRILGIILAIIGFAVFTLFFARADGWRSVFVCYGTVTVIAAFLILCCWLIFDE